MGILCALLLLLFFHFGFLFSFFAFHLYFLALFFWPIFSTSQPTNNELCPLTWSHKKKKANIFCIRIDLIYLQGIRYETRVTGLGNWATGRAPGGISLLLAQIKNFNLSPFSSLSLSVLHSLFDVYKIHAVTWCLKAPTGSSIRSSQQPCPRRCPRCLSALRAFNKLLTLYLIKVFFFLLYFFFSLRCFLYIFFSSVSDDVDAYQRSSLDSWDSCLPLLFLN